jgi:MYXO-CTERM domain-containing protein
VLALRCALACLALAVLVAAPRQASAQQLPAADPAVEQQVSTLEAEIAREDEALTTDNCGTACTALASMRRATQRLCALDPGPRCAAARARVDAASRRVLGACPECTADRDEAPRQVGGEAAPPAASRAPQAAPEPGSGGCAGCTVGGGGHAGALALAAAAALAALHRRRRRATRSSRE